MSITLPKHPDSNQLFHYTTKLFMSRYFTGIPAMFMWKVDKKLFRLKADNMYITVHNRI